MLEEANSKREIAERPRERVLRRGTRLRPRQYQHLPARSYPYVSFNKQKHLVHRLSNFQFKAFGVRRPGVALLQVDLSEATYQSDARPSHSKGALAVVRQLEAAS